MFDIFGKKRIKALEKKIEYWKEESHDRLKKILTLEEEIAYLQSENGSLCAKEARLEKENESLRKMIRDFHEAGLPVYNTHQNILKN